MSLGRGLVKEVKIKVDKDLNVSGFIDVPFRGKLNFTGKLDHSEFQAFPVIFHAKYKSYVKSPDDIVAPYPDRSAEQYLGRFSGDQEVTMLEMGVIENAGKRLYVEVYSKPYEDEWSFGTLLSEMEILEAKNVHNLEDVERRGG
ncbi:hypothetical protein KY329_01160 [Candidatus Woesearchaeota archaeon]|nr:hypothetical protein [Candidatus Woesearchaeota archaeon]